MFCVCARARAPGAGFRILRNPLPHMACTSILAQYVASALCVRRAAAGVAAVTWSFAILVYIYVHVSPNTHTHWYTVRGTRSPTKSSELDVIFIGSTRIALMQYKYQNNDAALCQYASAINLQWRTHTRPHRRWRPRRRRDQHGPTVPECIRFANLHGPTDAICTIIIVINCAAHLKRLCIQCTRIIGT